MFLKRSLPVGQTIAIKQNVLLHIGGIGAQRASIGAKHLLSQGAQSLISWGYAAGLDPIVRPGQLIIPEKIIDSEGNYFFADSNLCQQLQSAINNKINNKIHIHTGFLLQSAQMIGTISNKLMLFAEHRATAIDMESATIAKVAHQAGLPFMAVRAIADSAALSLPFWLDQSLNVDGQLRPIRFLRNFCRYPQTWLPLMHLFQGFNSAKNSLSSTAKLMGWKG